MKLQCCICGHKPEEYERFVKIESQLHGGGGVKQGVCLMVCTQHLSSEMTNALRIHNSFFADHAHQWEVEKDVFSKFEEVK